MQFCFFKPLSGLRGGPEETNPHSKSNTLSILFKDKMSFMHDRSYDKVPIPCLNIEKTKLYLGVLPRNELIVLHVPNVIH